MSDEALAEVFVAPKIQPLKWNEIKKATNYVGGSFRQHCMDEVSEAGKHG